MNATNAARIEAMESASDETSRLRSALQTAEQERDAAVNLSKSFADKWQRAEDLARDMARRASSYIEAVREHYQRGDNCCRLDDLRLYRAVLGESVLPVPGDMTIAQLTAEVERLLAQNASLDERNAFLHAEVNRLLYDKEEKPMSDHACETHQAIDDELARLQRQNGALRDLLSRALDEMAPNSDGDTPLMIAIRYELGKG